MSEPSNKDVVTPTTIQAFVEQTLATVQMDEIDRSRPIEVKLHPTIPGRVVALVPVHLAQPLEGGDADTFDPKRNLSLRQLVRHARAALAPWPRGPLKNESLSRFKVDHDKGRATATYHTTMVRKGEHYDHCWRVVVDWHTQQIELLAVQCWHRYAGTDPVAGALPRRKQRPPRCVVWREGRYRQVVVR